MSLLLVKKRVLPSPFTHYSVCVSVWNPFENCKFINAFSSVFFFICMCVRSDFYVKSKMPNVKHVPIVTVQCASLSVYVLCLQLFMVEKCINQLWNSWQQKALFVNQDYSVAKCASAKCIYPKMCLTKYKRIKCMRVCEILFVLASFSF